MDLVGFAVSHTYLSNYKQVCYVIIGLMITLIGRSDAVKDEKLILYLFSMVGRQANTLKVFNFH